MEAAASGARIPRAVLMRPIVYAQVYLWSTIVLFMLGPLFLEVENKAVLIAFVVACYATLYLGYWLGIRTKKNKVYYQVPKAKIRKAKYVVLLGAAYCVIYAINMMLDFGINSPMALVRAILNPGAAYSAKFEIYEMREELGSVNRLTQVLILMSLVYALFIPVLTAYWVYIKKSHRYFALFAVGCYLVAFLSIGTLKGIGDVLIFATAGGAVLLGRGALLLTAKQRRRLLAAIIVLLSLGFVYGGISQASRAEEFDIRESKITGDVSDTLLAKVAGQNIAQGFYTILAYPSHGYRGLSLDLQQDFVFSKGAGLSPAFESYRRQFLGGMSNFDLTYPARAELTTGWPAGMYWSTALPWFASDLTFPGVVILMGIVGFVFSRLWISCISQARLLSLALFGQMLIFIAFLPANNQVLMQRPGLWILSAAFVLFMLQKLARKDVR